MLTSSTSSASSGNRMSTISASLSGSLLLRASLIVVILPSETSLPSLVLGVQSAITSHLRSCPLSPRTSRPYPLACAFQLSCRHLGSFHHCAALLFRHRGHLSARRTRPRL